MAGNALIWVTPSGERLEILPHAEGGIRIAGSNGSLSFAFDLSRSGAEDVHDYLSARLNPGKSSLEARIAALEALNGPGGR